MSVGPVTHPSSGAASAASAGSTAPTGATQIAGSDGTNLRVPNVDAAGNLAVKGSIAAGAADSGAPVKIGGVYNSTPSTYTTGQRGDAHMGSRGALHVNLIAADGVTPALITTPIDANNGLSSLRTSANEMNYNGTFWDMKRHPNVFKTITATASGDTAVWTPTSGKKFRAMRYMILLTNEAALASAGALDVTLKDASTTLGLGHSFYVPSAGGTLVGRVCTPWIDIGNGILSALANNVLNINLSAALTAGKIRINICGTEE